MEGTLSTDVELNAVSCFKYLTVNWIKPENHCREANAQNRKQKIQKLTILIFQCEKLDSV